MLTSNKTSRETGAVFGDETPAAAILDRLHMSVRTPALGDGARSWSQSQASGSRARRGRSRSRASRIRTPGCVRTAENLAVDRCLASFHFVIESTIANLECRMRLEQHLAETRVRARRLAEGNGRSCAA